MHAQPPSMTRRAQHGFPPRRCPCIFSSAGSLLICCLGTVDALRWQRVARQGCPSITLRALGVCLGLKDGRRGA